MTLRPGANVIKLFTGVIYEFLEHAQDFVLGKLFEHNRMFVREARSIPNRKSLERYFIAVGSSLTHKH
jgi:hypothetical protein